jgi:enoyl-CoA hydratase/carnithine racemase
MSDAILFELQGPVALITINRPEPQRDQCRVRGGSVRRLEALRGGRISQGTILTDAGDKAFCAGMDLKEASATGLAVPPRGFIPTLGDAIHVSKPTIAAVNGMAVAGGWLFAQMCDLCVAAEHATFAITEARVGRGTPWAAPLIHMLPQRIMLELLLTGEPMGAARLWELGYVNHVVPRAQLRYRLSSRRGASLPMRRFTVRPAGRSAVHRKRTDRGTAGR